MRQHPALSRTYRCVSILLGRAALRADQHVHLLLPPVMRVQCAKSDRSSTQHQHYHVLSAAALNNSRKRNFVHRKDHGRMVSSAEHAGETYLNIHGIAFPGGEIRGFLAVPWSHCWHWPSRSDLTERWLTRLVATAAEDRLSFRRHSIRTRPFAAAREQSR